MDTLMWLSGTITTGNKDIFMFIPINKPIVGNKIQFNLYNLVVRQNGTYLYQSYNTEIVDVEVSTILFPNSGIYLTLTKESGWGGTNNDVASVAISFTIDIS